MMAGGSTDQVRSRAVGIAADPDVARADAPGRSDERATLVGVPRWQRDTLALTCSGLGPADLARRSAEPSTLSLLGLVHHLAEVERRWFRRVLAGQDVPLLFCTDTDPDGDFDRAAPGRAAGVPLDYVPEGRRAHAGSTARSGPSVVGHRQSTLRVVARRSSCQQDQTMMSSTDAYTYRSLFAIREFRVLFLNVCALVISVAASGLALATITYEATGSAVVSGLALFGGPLVSIVVSQLLLAMSDQVRPRTALMCQMGAALVANALQLLPGLPWQARFALLAIPYVVNAMFAGTQWALVRDTVPEESYILARSTMNLADGGMQVVGFGIGGLALLWLSPPGLFLVAAVADLLALINVRLGIRDRPARAPAQDGKGARLGQAGKAGQAEGGGAGDGVVRRTAAVNRRLLRSPVTRPLYLALWVPNGLIVGCESLFVPYAHSGPGGPGVVAGWLFAATAAGMMAGDLLVGRLIPPRRRDRLIEPLRLLLATPYLLFFLGPPTGVAAPLGFLAAVGYAASLPLQDRLIRHTDDAIQGQALGLHSNGMLVWQALGAIIAGAVASFLPATAAMGVMAVASTAVTVLLVRGLRRSAPVKDAP